MAKESMTLFNGSATNGLNVVSDIDANAYESAAFYFVLGDKPAGNVTYNLYGHEPVTNTYTSIAGNILTANGTYRTEIAHVYDRYLSLQFYVPGDGATVTAVLVLDDKE